MADMPLIVCPGCGFKGRAKKFSTQPKQVVLRMALWLFFLLPGALYDIATENRFVCPKCGAEIEAQ